MSDLDQRQPLLVLPGLCPRGMARTCSKRLGARRLLHSARQVSAEPVPGATTFRSSSPRISGSWYNPHS